MSSRRKAAVIGFLVLVGAALCLAACFPTRLGALGWLWCAGADIALLGVACLWWRLVRRSEVPAAGWLRQLGHLLGGLSILCILAGVVGMLTAPALRDSAEMAGILGVYGIPLGIHVAVLFRLLSRPRLVLTWVLGIVLTPLFALVPCLFMVFLSGSGQGGETAVYLFVGIMAGWGPMLAPLLGLPFAWLWVRRAEREAARKPETSEATHIHVRPIPGQPAPPAKVGKAWPFVASGAVLAVVAFVIGAISPSQQTLRVLSAFLFELSVACLWWPVLRREDAPLKDWVTRAIMGVGFLSLALVAGAAVFCLLRRDLLGFLPIVLGHAVFNFYLFRRPRLLLPWSIALILLTLAVSSSERAAALYGDATYLAFGFAAILAAAPAWLWQGGAEGFRAIVRGPASPGRNAE